MMADEDGLFDDTDGQPVMRRRHVKRRAKLIVAALFFVLLIAGAVGILVALCVVVGQMPPRVHTSCGKVEGIFNPQLGVYSFKGIPFAEPPEGKNRWKLPVPLSTSRGNCWEGVIQTKEDPPECKQITPTNEIAGKEDCLYLNVYTPTLDLHKLKPVMVYIHGGYLQFSNASQALYTPDENTANDLDVVFVSIQYRLTAFGFLVLDALPGTGNYGIHDQVEALRWVQNNIANFGGDPNQVTVFGQSSGATSIWALLMAPSTAGLFQKAWMLSGSPIFNKTLAEARQENLAILAPNTSMYQKCGHNVTEECLMNLSADEVLTSVYPFWDIVDDSMDLPDWGYFEPALLVVDGVFIPEAPFEAWDNRTGNYLDVPIIIGTTAQELDMSPTPKDVDNWDRSQYEAYVSGKFDAFGHNLTSDALRLYSWDDYDTKNKAEYLFTTLGTDIRITCGINDQTAKAAKALSSKVYRYVITSSPSSPINVFGMPFAAKFAFHAWDDFAFMGTVDKLMKNNAEVSDMQFSRALQDEILHFIKNGVPRSNDWLPYPQKTALIDTEVKVIDGEYHGNKCAVLDSHGLLAYGWIN